jgi:hypothetical protein
MQTGSQVFDTSYGFAIRYNIAVSVVPGYDVSEMMKLDLALKFGVPAKVPVLLPRGNIEFRADFELFARGATLGAPPAEISFLQSVTGAEQVATYGDDQEQRRFLCDHDEYPVKDGSGNPWYKDDWAQREIFKIANRSLTTTPIRSWVAVHDKPKFAFPKLLGSKSRRNEKGGIVGLKFKSATSEMRFITCLALKVGARLHPIHSIRWKFEARADPATGWPVAPPNAEEQGISVIDHHGPYTIDSPLPEGIKLVGPSANDSEHQRLDPA